MFLNVKKVPQKLVSLGHFHFTLSNFLFVTCFAKNKHTARHVRYTHRNTHVCKSVQKIWLLDLEHSKYVFTIVSNKATSRPQKGINDILYGNDFSKPWDTLPSCFIRKYTTNLSGNTTHCFAFIKSLVFNHYDADIGRVRRYLDVE